MQPIYYLDHHTSRFDFNFFLSLGPHEVLSTALVTHLSIKSYRLYQVTFIRRTIILTSHIFDLGNIIFVMQLLITSNNITNIKECYIFILCILSQLFNLSNFS